jgi:putative transferase (TIGR04331 family)
VDPGGSAQSQSQAEGAATDSQGVRANPHVMGRGGVWRRRLRRAFDALRQSPGLSVRAELHGVALTLKERLALQFRLAPAHFLLPLRLPPNTAQGVKRSDWEQWPAYFQIQNDFEFCVTQLLFRYMPPEYFEIYLQTRRRFKLKHAVLLGADAYTPRSADLISEVRAAGGRVYSYQHGGGYGHYAAFANEDIERFDVDGFITWGWSDNKGPTAPLPSPYLSALPSPAAREETLLLVGTMLPPALYKMQTALAPEQLLPYIQDKRVFINALSENLRRSVEYRGARLDFGVREREQAAEFLPAAQISDEDRLTNRVRDCRLAVFDHMSTSFLEALTMNAPTILFWRPEFYGLNARTRSALAKLESVGIYHRDPAAAAARVMQVWNQVDAWWSSEALQKARRDFCDSNARRENNWLKVWRRSETLR